MNMLLLLIAAGMGLVVQNLLMVRMTESVSTILITLVINSSVGLLLLVGLLLAKNGLGAVAEVTGAARWWMLLPGLLGSLFVFAGILGCKTGRGGHHLDPGRQPAVHGAAGGRLPRRPGGAARESAGAVRRPAAGGGRLSGGETQL